MARRYLKINGVWQDHDLFALLQDDARRVRTARADADGAPGPGQSMRAGAPGWRAVALAVPAARWRPRSGARARRARASRPSTSTTTPIASRSPRWARPTKARGDTLQIETAPGADGVTRRMSVRAATPGTNPAWFVFALTQHHRQADRALAGGRPLRHGRAPAWCGPTSTRAASSRHALASAMCPSASRTTAPTCSASRWSPARPSPSSPSSPPTASRASISGRPSSTSRRAGTASSSTASCWASPACSPSS